MALPKNQLSEHPLATTEHTHQYINVMIVAIISSFFVTAWLVAYGWLNALVWQNNFVETNRWMTLVIPIIFSAIVGSLIKYYNAPTCLEGSFTDNFRGKTSPVTFKKIVMVVVMSLASLLSSAVVGPEGAIGRFAVDIANWYTSRFAKTKAYAEGIILGSLSAAYNGLLESPIFTAVLANDISQNKQTQIQTLPANLLAGAIGYFLFLLIGNKGFVDYLNLQNFQVFHTIYILYAIVFAIVGVVLAAIAKFAMQIATRFFDRFNNQVIIRALLAGVIFGIVGYLFPMVMFSGEDQIQSIVSNQLNYAVVTLLLLAIGKLFLLAISFRSGFLGGPTFPSIFASVCVALAINLIFPQIPLILIIAGIASGLMMMLFKLPFMVLLFITFFLAANTTLVALIIISIVTVMILGPRIERLAARTSR